MVVACATPAPPTSGTPSTPSAPAPFDAAAAYNAFEQALRAYYGYLARDDFDVEAHLARTKSLALHATSARELRSLLNTALLAFTDPHLTVMPLDDDDANVWPTACDLDVRAEGDAWVVEDVRAGSPADVAGVRPGWRVVDVDGVAVDAAVAPLLVPQPTLLQRSYAGIHVVNGKRSGGDRLITFQTPAGVRTLTLGNPRAFARSLQQQPLVDVEVSEHLGVIRLNNSLGDRKTIAAFDDAVRRCAGVRDLIVDLRNTPSGGNTDVARAMIGHFITTPTPFQVHEVPATERETSVPRHFVEYAMPRAPHHAGRVLVLGGRWTGSMGEGTVIGLDAAGATTFTSNMADLLGGLHVFAIPELGADLELGAETLFHVDGTPRAAYVGDVVLPIADRDAEGGDPARVAVERWRQTP